MKTILVVEDEYAIAQMLMEVLEDEGYRVLLAVNGQDGLECLRRERPDLILCDIMMPIMDGREMFRQVQLNPTYRTIPFIMMSAVPQMVSDEERYSAFLSKPLNLDYLLETVAPLVGI